MEKTFVKLVKYRDVRFSGDSMKSQGNQFSFFTLDKFDFFYVETATKDTPYKLRHGYIGGFTQNKRRKVQLSFSAYAHTEEERRNLIKQVNKLFQPPYNPNFTDNRGYYKMEFTTIDDVVREFGAKVISRPKEKDVGNINHIAFDVEFITEDSSTIYGKEKTTINDRNYIRGISLPVSLDTPFSYYPSSPIVYNGVSETFAKCTITALQDNATIGSIQILSIRQTSFSRMFFNLEMNAGDTLVIDPISNLVELNGVDITGDLELSFGNNYPVLLPGDNPQKLIVDTGKTTQTCDITREYSVARN